MSSFQQKAPSPQDSAPEAGEVSEHGWVGYNSGPCEWLWSEDRTSLEHELTDEIRAATHLEKYLLNLQGNRTHEHDDQAGLPQVVAPPLLTNEQKEIVLLNIIAGMSGRADSSESKWSWLNWFCEDEEHGKRSDTFNRCEEKGWLFTTHDTSFDVSTTVLTDAGRAVVELNKN